MVFSACVFALLSINPKDLPKLGKYCERDMCHMKMVDLRRCEFQCEDTLHLPELAGPDPVPSLSLEVPTKPRPVRPTFPPIPPGFEYNPKTGYIYKYVKERATWEDAEKECRTQGATLASVHSASENEFISRLTKNFAPTGLSPYNTLWLGRLKTKPGGGGFIWHDGTAFNFTKWAEHHPNNLESGDNCIALYNRRLNTENASKYFKHWIDLCCTKRLKEGFVCKKFYGFYNISPAQYRRLKRKGMRKWKRSRRSRRKLRRSRRKLRRSRRRSRKSRRSRKRSTTPKKTKNVKKT